MMKKLFLILVVAGVLSGCVPVVACTAIGATSGAIINDKRPLKVMMKDDDIAYAIEKKLFYVEELRNQCHIGVTAYRGVVLLVGQAPTQALKDKATQVAKTEPGVRRLYNQIITGAPTSNLTCTSDSWITTKVRTELLTAKNLKSGQFKVLTENGTVFLMGVVTRSQAQHAVDIARHVDGVQKVVKVFEYTRDAVGSTPPPPPKKSQPKKTSPRAQNDSTAAQQPTQQPTQQPRTVTMAQTDEALYKKNGA